MPTKLRELMGAIKDKASISKAVLSNPTTVSLRVALLRATTHDPSSPPRQKHLSALLSFGNGSRAAASPVVKALMDRLQLTHDSSVAVKCLISVHHIIKHGSFIIQDQLSVFPAAGGRNYLNLARFRDASSPGAWELSGWVRWFANFVEHLMCTSRVLGFFLCSSSSTLEKEQRHEALPSISNRELLKETDSLVGLVEAACNRPDSFYSNNLVVEIVNLVSEDCLSATNEIAVRVSEFRERIDLGQLGFGESVELICGLKRLEGCKEKTAAMLAAKKEVMESFWDSITETKKRVWNARLGCDDDDDGGARLARGGRRVSESARFDYRVVRSGDSTRFPSARLDVNVTSRFQFQNLDTVQSLCPR